MCGRARLKVPFRALAALYRCEPVDLEDLLREEIRPTNKMAVVRLVEGRRRLVTLRWGLVPHWAPDLKFGSKTFNARAETAATKPAFRSAWKSRRCLVVVDGFYEWSGEGKVRHPNLIRLEGDAPFAIAGLWDSWGDKATGEVTETCTMLTRESAGAAAALHGRMPIVLPEDVHDAWLDPATGDPAAALQRAVTDRLVVVPLEQIPKAANDASKKRQGQPLE